MPAPGRSAVPLWIGVAFIVAPCLALAVLAIIQVVANTPRLERSREEVAQAFETVTTVGAIGRAVRDAERGQRGYLITGDAAYLEPYRGGVEAVPRLLTTLRALVAAEPEQLERLTALQRQIDVKFAELRESVAARDRDGFEAARRIVATNVGIDAMRSIDAALDALAASENAALRQGEAAVLRDQARVTTLAWLIGALALGALGLGSFVLWRFVGTLRSAEAARGISEEALRRLIDGARDYAIYMLDPRGVIRTWNTGAERIKGYGAAEVIGQNFAMFYTAEERAAEAPRRALETAAREGRFEAESWRVRKGGERFFANVVIDAIYDGAGQVLGFAKITRDVSERVQAQQALEETRARLAQAQKMEALGQLTGGVAHDFNNMLHVMLGGLDMLQRHVAMTAPEFLSALDLARQSANRAATLTRQLLAFARRQPLRPQPIDPNRLIAGMSELLRRTLGEGIGIETVLAGGVWSMSVDANQLESAILNLALNARDAMPNGGRLTIETANAYLDEAYAREHVEVTAGQYVMIAVTDTGTGMPSDVLEKAFDPFFTTKEIGRGTGLGLSQVFGFVKQSDGHVKIYSEPGQGTTVKLYLPRHAAAAIQEEAAAPAATPRGDASKTVLVVEDDEAARTYCGELVRELGYRVVAAPDGPSALLLVESEPAIDLLFTDVGLPGGMNGRQLAEAVRERRPGIKVLFTTAYARNAIIHQGRLDAGVELILKPFTYEELGTKLRQMLGAGA